MLSLKLALTVAGVALASAGGHPLPELFVGTGTSLIRYDMIQEEEVD